MPAQRRLPRTLRHQKERSYALTIWIQVRPMRLKGRTLQQCCDVLNRTRWKTFTGKDWTVGRLSQVIKMGQVEAMDTWVFTPSPMLYRHMFELAIEEDLASAAGEDRTDESVVDEGSEDSA